MLKSVLTLILTIALLAAELAGGNVPLPQILPAAEPDTVQSAGGLDDYMTSVAVQSSAIKDFLEYEAMTQTDMNLKSQELYELWDGALNYLWAELKNRLPEEDFAALENEQLAWNTEKEHAVKEAGREFEGGSIYPLVVNSEAARLTEERAYRLYNLLKEAETP